MMEFSFDGSGNYYCAVRLLHNVTLLGTCPSLNGSVINSRINQWATTVFINIGYPLLLVMATLGNGGYLVFLSFQKRSTRTLYLAVTALSGIILIWLELPRFLVTSSDSLRRHRDFIVYVLHSMGLQLFAEDLFSQISNWTIIALSMERVLVISKPLQYRHGVPLRYGYLVVMGIGVLALAVAIPGIVVFYWSLNAIGIFAANECTNHAMAITLHDVRNLAKILVIVEGLYVAIVVPLVTSVIMFVTSLVLVIQILRSSAYRKRHLQSAASNGSNSTDPGAGAPPSRSLALSGLGGHRTLFRAILGYFITQLPRVIHSLYTIVVTPRCYIVMTLQLHMQNRAAPAVSTLFLLNYAVTFLYHNNLLKQVRTAWRARKYGAKAAGSKIVLMKTLTLKPTSSRPLDG